MRKIRNIVWSILIVVIFVTLGIWYLNKTGSTPGNIKPGNTVVIPNTNKLINSFVFSELNPEAYGAIDNTNYAVNLLVPTGTDLTTLTPTILVSDGATVSPASGAAENLPTQYLHRDCTRWFYAKLQCYCDHWYDKSSKRHSDREFREIN